MGPVQASARRSGAGPSLHGAGPRSKDEPSPAGRGPLAPKTNRHLQGAGLSLAPKTNRRLQGAGLSLAPSARPRPSADLPRGRPGCLRTFPAYRLAPVHARASARGCHGSSCCGRGRRGGSLSCVRPSGAAPDAGERRPTSRGTRGGIAPEQSPSRVRLRRTLPPFPAGPCRILCRPRSRSDSRHSLCRVSLLKCGSGGARRR